MGGEGGASQRQCPLVAVRMIRMAVRIDDVSDRERLRAGTLDEDLRRIRGIDQHPGLRVAVSEQIAEVAIAADANLFEDESHLRLLYHLCRTRRMAGLLHFLRGESARA